MGGGYVVLAVFLLAICIRIIPSSQDGIPSEGEASRQSPVLVEGSFGFRHASHLNSGDQFLDREQQQTNFRFCPLDQLQCSRKALAFRTADGSCNNLRRPHLGKSGLPYRRLLPKVRGSCANSAGFGLPNARVASRLLFERSEADVSRDLSMYVMVFGQLVDHDLMLTPVRRTEGGNFLDCCRSENLGSQDCCTIMIPEGDHFFGREGRPVCIPFIRSQLTPSFEGCMHRLPPDIRNENTPWLDLSLLYGSTEGKAHQLKGSDGTLATSTQRAGRVFPRVSFGSRFMMVLGDARGDIHPPFTLMLNAYLRNHNRLARRLRLLHREWSDDRLFEEAKKINVAVGQHIVYTQFLDALLGPLNNVGTNDGELHRDYYREAVDPRISLMFSTVAFRLHSHVGGQFELRDSTGRLTSTMLLRDVFNNPLKLLEGDNYDDLTRGLAFQSLRDFNNVFTQELTEWLFADVREGFGLDLISLNIQRGRDHQIPSYSDYRELCGFGSVRDWSDMESLISAHNVRKLRRVYLRPGDVDAYVGANMETSVGGSVVGPTLHCYIREQFERLRDGDRFFYTRPSEFTAAQLTAIKRMSLSHLLCLTADSPRQVFLPPNAFLKVNLQTNPALNCMRFQDLDLNPWR